MELKIFLLFCFVSIATGQWVKEMENNGLYEGDMVLSPEQLKAAKEGKLSYATTKNNHWPTTIAYDWAPERANNSGILAAIADYHKYTCLKFVKRTNEKAYMYFFVGGGCYSSVGYRGRKLSISIGNGCTRKGTVLHEMAHALGIYHEQSRPDRDNYVEIKLENVRGGMEHNFRKQSASNIDSLGTPYDYLSMMHYPDWGFSKNGKPTIVTKDKSMQKVIGQRSGFSKIDIEQINLMYCKDKPVPSTKRPDTTPSVETKPVTTETPKTTPSPKTTPTTETNGECTFQNGLCTWFNHRGIEDDFDWTIGSGRTDSSSTGPSADRNGNLKGNYLFLESSNPRVNGDKTRLVSQSFSAKSATGQCFHFFYHMYGSSIGSLNVFVNTTESEKLVWTLSGNKGNKWFNAQVNVGAGFKAYKIIIEGIRANGYRGDIAIDDFTFTPGSCSTIPSNAKPTVPTTKRPDTTPSVETKPVTTEAPSTTPSPRTTPTTETNGECTFQNGFCTWFNDRTSDDFNWVVGSGRTDSSSTGPSADWNGNVKGNYLYVESSNPRVVGDKTRLVSRSFSDKSATGQCFGFFYHMYGSSIGTLNVYVQTSGIEKLVWTLSGDKGNQWFNGQVNVGAGFQTYKVIIEGVVGKSYRGDIPIDDFIFTPGSCSTVPSNASPKPTVTTTRTPTVTPSPQPAKGDCTFQNGLCNWFNQPSIAKVDEFDWTVGAGKTPSSATGPSADRNGNIKGNYLFLEASNPRVVGDKTRLVSAPFIETSGTGQCFNFYYHMYGSHTGTLNVYVKTNGTEKLVWTKGGNQGNKWFNGQVTVGAGSNNYEVIIEGIRAIGYEGDIAIDDFTFTPGSCSSIYTTPAPKGSGECTFQNGFCNWFINQINRVDNFDWTVGSGKTPSSSTGPSADRNGDIKGKYIYVEASNPRVAGDKTRLTSQSFTANSTTGQCFHFFYHMYGSRIGFLKVYVKTTGSEKLVWTLSGNKGNQWFNGQVNVGAGSMDYRIIVEGVVGKGYTGDIAIDDFTFTPGNCSTLPLNARPKLSGR